MSTLNFPATGLVANVTIYTGSNGVTYLWDGVKWVAHALAQQPLASNSLINNGYVVQLGGDGNLIIPAGGLIKDPFGNIYGFGTQGTSGNIGNTGTQGVQGLSIQGAQGLGGNIGTDGVQGVQGSQGHRRHDDRQRHCRFHRRSDQAAV